MRALSPKPSVTRESNEANEVKAYDRRFLLVRGIEGFDPINFMRIQPEQPP